MFKADDVGSWSLQLYLHLCTHCGKVELGRTMFMSTMLAVFMILFCMCCSVEKSNG